ncbi:BgtTE-56058 [Blumeria graminis f. sp. tritici]|nr:BgtTE-56058 [Blumeria graminis f. sp. tritici]
MPRWHHTCLCCGLGYVSLTLEGKTEHLYAMSSTNLGVKYSPIAKFSQISQYQRSWPTRQKFILLLNVVFSLPTSLTPT